MLKGQLERQENVKGPVSEDRQETCGESSRYFSPYLFVSFPIVYVTSLLKDN
jgi:hypothetical protein